MRKHSRRIKTRRRRNSRKLRGGNPLARFFGFGQPPPAPGEAQAQQVQAAQDDEVAGLQQMTESKQQQASTLRDQCQDYQRKADELDEQAANHMRATQEISRNRESKNRCDQEQAMRLQAIEQDYQQRLAQLSQEHNTALYDEKQRAQEQHNNCLREGMRLSDDIIARARQPEDAMNAAALAIQAQRRGQLGRRAAMGPAGERRVERARAAAEALPQRTGMLGGRKSRRGGRKSRRGGSGCGTHKKKKMYGGRKSRRGGTKCGMMYGGRKSRRGGTKCSPKLRKKCPHYKKYGQHM